METNETSVEQPVKVPSYRSLGLTAKFARSVVDRQAAYAKMKQCKSDVDTATTAIKQFFTEKVMGMEVDPSDEDSFKELVTAAADSGEALCSVTDGKLSWKAGLVPGERSTIDEKELKLAMLDAEIPMATIDKIVKKATKVSRWGEISIELMPTGEKVERKKRAAKKVVKAEKVVAKRKVKKPAAPVSPRATKKRR